MSIQRKSERGASLVEMMLVLALMAILLSSLMDMFSLVSLQAATQKANFNFETLKQNVSRIMSDDLMCGQAFWNAGNTAIGNFPPANPTDSYTIRLGAEILAGPNLDIGNGVKISGVHLVPVAGLAPVTVAGVTSQYVELRLSAIKPSNTLGSNLITNYSNPLRFKLITDATQKITGCKLTKENEIIYAEDTVTRTPAYFTATPYESTHPATDFASFPGINVTFPAQTEDVTVAMQLGGYINFDYTGPGSCSLNYQIQINYSMDGGTTWYPGGLYGLLVLNQGTSYFTHKLVALPAGQSLIIRPKFRTQSMNPGLNPLDGCPTGITITDSVSAALSVFVIR